MKRGITRRARETDGGVGWRAVACLLVGVAMLAGTSMPAVPWQSLLGSSVRAVMAHARRPASPQRCQAAPYRARPRPDTMAAAMTDDTTGRST